MSRAPDDPFCHARARRPEVDDAVARPERRNEVDALPIPGKRTRTETPPHRPARDDLPPGRRTQVDRTYPDIGRHPEWLRFVTHPELLATAPSAVRATLENFFRIELGAARQVATVAPRLGLDPASITIVTDDSARARLDAAGARGLADGDAIYLHPDVYDPDSSDGAYLVGHELAHVAQARRGPGRAELAARAELEAHYIGQQVARGGSVVAPTEHLARSAADTGLVGADRKVIAAPVRLTITAQVNGLHCTAPPAATYAPGVDRSLQATAALLRALVGARYDLSLLDATTRELGVQPLGAMRGTAQPGERVGHFVVEPMFARALLAWLDARELPVALTETQRDMVAGAASAVEIWPLVEAEGRLPPWYSQRIFSAVAFSHAGLLRATRGAGAQGTSHVAAQFVAALTPGAAVLDAIRADERLVDQPGYRGLWNLPARASGAPPGVPVASDSQPNAALAARFLLELHSHPSQASAALTSPQARATLLRNFASRLADDPRAALEGDAAIRDQPSRANTPALRSRLAAFPALSPPRFERARGAETTFSMVVDFPDLFEALGRVHYLWEVVRVPDKHAKAMAAAASGGGGERQGWGDLLGHRLQQTAGNAEVDMARATAGSEPMAGAGPDAATGAAAGPAAAGGTAASRPGGAEGPAAGIVPGLAVLGPPGIGVTGLAAANAVVGFGSNVVRTIVEASTVPRSTRTIALGEVGLFIVRCIATPQPGKDAVIVRAPSVAWLPVQVRPGAAIAELGVQRQLAARASAQARLGEIDRERQNPSLSPERRAALDAERASISAEVGGSVGDSLRQEQSQLAAMSRAPTLPGGSKGPAPDVSRRIDDIGEILDLRAERLGDRAKATGREAPVRLISTFVGDDGSALNLLLEAIPDGSPARTSGAPRVTYRVIDSTTRNSGHHAFTAPTREAAIEGAIRALLESGVTGYGRGSCAISIPPPAGASGPPLLRTIRIEKDLAGIAMEGVESAARIVSIASLVAAPLTGGASLALLVPVSVIGAIPSAYRLVERGAQGTLRMDLATAMDLVGVLGAAAGLGQIASGSLQLVRLNGAFLVTNLGTDGLGMCLAGAGFVDQLETIDPDLPPELRRARVMELVARQLIDLGIEVGHSLAARAQHDAAVQRARGQGADDDVPAASGRRPSAEGAQGAESAEGLADTPVGAVRGSSVYGLDGKLGPVSIEGVIGKVAAMGLARDARVAQVGADRYQLTVARAGGATASVDLRVHVSSDLPGSEAHGAAAGPGRFVLKRPAQPGAPWTGEVFIDSRLKPRDARFVVRHELDEIALIVADDTPEHAIAAEQEARLFRPDGSPGDTAISKHDQATARELLALVKDAEAAMAPTTAGANAGAGAITDATIRRAQDPTAPSRPEVAAKLDRIDALMDEMGLYSPDRRADKLRVIQEAGAVPDAVMQQLERLIVNRGVFRAVHGGKTAKAGSLITAALIQHLSFPAAQVNFVGFGLHGGHDDTNLQTFIARNPSYRLTVLAAKGICTSYKQERVVGGVAEVAAPPKTTVTNLPLFLIEADSAIREYFSRNAPAASDPNMQIGSTLGGVTITTASGIELGGFVAYDSGSGEITITSVFPDAAWVQK